MNVIDINNINIITLMMMQQLDTLTTMCYKVRRYYNSRFEIGSHCDITKIVFDYSITILINCSSIYINFLFIDPFMSFNGTVGRC